MAGNLDYQCSKISHFSSWTRLPLRGYYVIVIKSAVDLNGLTSGKYDPVLKSGQSITRQIQSTMTSTAKGAHMWLESIGR